MMCIELVSFVEAREELGNSQRVDRCMFDGKSGDSRIRHCSSSIHTVSDPMVMSFD